MNPKTEWFARPVLHVKKDVEASLLFYVDPFWASRAPGATTRTGARVAKVERQGCALICPTSGRRRLAGTDIHFSER